MTGEASLEHDGPNGTQYEYLLRINIASDGRSTFGNRLVFGVWTGRALDARWSSPAFADSFRLSNCGLL